MAQGGAGKFAAEHHRLGLIAGSQTEIADQMEQFTKAQPDPVAIWVRYDNAQAPAMQLALKDGELQGYVEFARPTATGEAFPKVEYVSVEKEPSPAVITLLQTGLQEAKVNAMIGRNTLTREQVREISTPVTVDSREVNSPSEAGRCRLLYCHWRPFISASSTPPHLTRCSSRLPGTSHFSRRPSCCCELVWNGRPCWKSGCPLLFWLHLFCSSAGLPPKSTVLAS
ncbi:hypothetical protein QOZ95_005581 [Paenibacillus brasilensis]|uniref:Uncharacterized protein n=1 Tax=Paenibacillus brasilensis TaxID=128574 RepID=A0ABU0L7V4_9BACL|nr:hypothetical protein [Paenibacillus brasilensis]